MEIIDARFLKRNSGCTSCVMTYDILLGIISEVLNTRFCNKAIIGTEKAKKILSSIGRPVTQKTVCIVPHAHLDPEWKLPFNEQCEISSKVLAGAVHMLDKNPSFRFLAEPVVVVKYFLEHYPEYEEKFVRFTREGRLEIPGMWVSPDENIPSEESLIRNFAIAHKWLREKGITSGKTAWQADVFGHPASSPHMFKNAGCEYYTFARMDLTRIIFAELLRKFEPEGEYHPILGLEKLHYGSDTPRVVDFWWEGVGGLRILTHWMKTHYNSSFLSTIPMEKHRAFSKIALAISLISQCSPASVMMLPCGDDFTNPETSYPNLCEVINEWNAELAEATGYSLVIATPAEFFKALEKESSMLPVYKGDYNPALGSMCLVDRIEFKQLNREMEHAIFSAERFSVVASSLGRPYPENELSGCFEDMCLGFHHDTITGTSPSDVAIKQLERFTNTSETSKGILYSTLSYISDRIDTSKTEGVPLIVFNPLSWERTDLLEINMVFHEPGYKMTVISECSGRQVESQLRTVATHSDGSLKQAYLIFIAEDVPSLGYKTYGIRCLKTLPKEDQLHVSVDYERNIIENSRYRIATSPQKGACITGLFDKKAQKEIIGPSGRIFKGAGFARVWGNDLIATSDIGGFAGMFFSCRDIIYTSPFLFKTSDFQTITTVMEDGPLMKTLRAKVKSSDTTFIKEISIYDKLERIDFKTSILSFDEAKNITLEVTFPFGIEGGVPIYETSFGVIPRADKRYNYPAYTFVDIANKEHGVALINKGNPGYHVEGNIVTMLLMKQTGKGYENSQGKEFTFRYSLMPHQGDWESAGLYKKGREYNFPLIANWTGRHEGILPPEHGFVCLSNEKVAISALKMDKDGSVILRLYNHGNNKNKGSVSLGNLFVHNVTGINACQIDSSENELSTLDSSIKTDGAKIFFDLEANGLLSLKINKY